MQQFHKDALKIGELQTSLENISSDDNKKISDYSQKEIVDEAEYVLSNFNEGGHAINEALEDGSEPDLKKQLTALKRFIKKYR